jgi:hydroxyethylthiazole kinase-like uncharacterized protein yjeF
MTLQRLDGRQPTSLHDIGSTRQLEQALAVRLPTHTLMRRAGQSIGQLALALAPHARKIWIACGPGNNGGDGLEAAVFLHQAGMPVLVSHLLGKQELPPDAQAALQRAQAAGIEFILAPPALTPGDLAIDCLLGIGASRAVTGEMAAWITAMNDSEATVLSADPPTGLNAETGLALLSEDGTPGPLVNADHTLMLLTAKPGLFMGQGRDAAGQLWLDDLTRDASEKQMLASADPCSQLNPAPTTGAARRHNSHKGSYGDVAIVGGEALAVRGMGMTGAALLAASAALHGGAGRVLISLLAPTQSTLAVEVIAEHPEWMLRTFSALHLQELTVVCGCGGGLAVKHVMAEVLQRSQQLVLDADALNAIARDASLAQLLKNRSARAMPTVLTPHPLEAARLLNSSTSEIQAHRLHSAETLAALWGCTVVLKGSGTVIACPGQISRVNPTGNGRLATAGTGDVLAGWIGAKMAQGPGNAWGAFEAASQAVYQHGHAADQWPALQQLTASALAQQVT